MNAVLVANDAAGIQGVKNALGIRPVEPWEVLAEAQVQSSIHTHYHSNQLVNYSCIFK